VRGYTKLEGILSDFARSQVLPYNPAAADVFEDLRKQRIRIGTMDLRIGAIALTHGMTVLTRNLVDFRRVPNPNAEDWTL
jgi:tRNA(fMet)-specific endonuclease VapC